MAQLITSKPGYSGLTSKKIGRNEKCSCESGKKAKNCCGVDTKYYSRDKLSNSK